ncbi:MAG: GNAT family N-acetyltransferase [Bacteroidota bacterium]
MSSFNFMIKQGWPSDLGETAKFLQHSLIYDTLPTSLLEEKLTGDPYADPDLCFTAYENWMITGFIFCVRRTIRNREYGYIKLMAVEKQARRKNMGTKLYQEAEKELVRKGAKIIRWGDSPFNYFMPGIDPRYTAAFCFAEKMGFKKFDEAINMFVDLKSRNWETAGEEEKLAKLDIEVRRATYDDMEGIDQLLSTEWDLWKHEVSVAMKDNPPSVHIALKKGSILAFSAHNGNNRGTGWFGPMGTHPNMRGSGIGTVLLKRCLEDMKKQGHHYATIPWVEPVAFYSHFAGAVIDRVFWRMEKLIEAQT